MYLADQAHVPYGERTEEDLRGILRDNVATLEAAGVDAIVMGCNTSCAIAAKYGWPPARVPILDLIDAAAADVAARKGRRIGVLATTATARSGAYGAAIRRVVADADVQEVAAPKLVPLVESGVLDGSDAALEAVEEACAPFRFPLDMLVLACTHYPLLDASFAAVLGSRVQRIDPALSQAEGAVAWVRARGALRRRHETGTVRYVTTGPREPFLAALTRIVGNEVEPADIVALALPAGR